MFCCNPIRDELKDTDQFKSFRDAQLAAIAMIVVSVAFVLLGAGLMQYSLSPQIISQGYAFVFHFVGTHAFGFGLLLTLATVAISGVTLHRRLQLN